MTETLALVLAALAALAVTPTPGQSGASAKPAISGTIKANVGLSGEWALTALPGARTSIDAQAPPTLAIDGPAKQISGSTGCNQFFCTLAGGTTSALSLSPTGTTMKACPDGAMALETAYLAALRKVNAYRIRGATLELLAGDHVLARFERRRSKTPSD